MSGKSANALSKCQRVDVRDDAFTPELIRGGYIILGAHNSNLQLIEAEKWSRSPRKNFDLFSDKFPPVGFYRSISTAVGKGRRRISRGQLGENSRAKQAHALNQPPVKAAPGDEITRIVPLPFVNDRLQFG